MSGTSGIVTFSYPVWAQRFPELAGSVSGGLANAYFAEAQLFLANTLCSPVQDVGQRGLLLNLIVAHLAALNSGVNGQPSSPLVGRIASATEGSVSVSTDLQTPAGAAYWAQTKYGLQFWQSTAALRTFRYAPRPVFPGPGYGYGFPGGWR
jgi:hypothetical protein